MNINGFDDGTQKEKNAIEKGTLYLVATPIGNTSDMSARGLKVIAGVDFVAAEDTRNTGGLMAGFGIKKHYVSYHEHNKAEAGLKIVERLKNGESAALVTDAGMPGISDPGEDLVRMCIEQNVKVTCVPGACALTTALVLSGLNTGRFSFEGFLKGTSSEREKTLKDVKDDERTLIFYEAPHRLRSTLREMLDIFGERNIAVCRELTKLNEEIVRTTFSGAIRDYEEKEPRGEYVIVVEGAKVGKLDDWTKLTVGEHIDFYMNSMNMSKMDAIKATAKDRGVPKGEIYKIAVSDGAEKE